MRRTSVIAGISTACLLAAALGTTNTRAQQEDAPKAVPLQEAKLDVPRLKAWGTRRFSYVVDRNGERTALGTVTLRTGISGDRVDMHDSWALKWHGKDLSLDLKLACKAGGLLRPTSIRSVGKGDDEVATFTVDVGTEKAEVKMEDGRTREMKLPADTLTDCALLRVFTLLPQEKGKSYGVGHSLEVSELNLKGPAEITCDGPDEIKLRGQRVKSVKFVFRQQGRVVEEAWVDGDGVLRQVRIDGRKVLVEEPDPAGPATN
jgi:hypothetical protein